MSDWPNAPPKRTAPNPCSTIRDVADFHMRWAEFRPMARAVSANGTLSEAEQDVMVWMIALLDRIGPQDLDSDSS